MTLLQIEYFQTLAKTKSFSIASKLLGISQSTLNITINRLEQELKYPLLERQSRGISLTPYGEKVLYYSYSILHALEDIKLNFQEQKGISVKEKLSLGVTDSNYYGDWVLDLLDQYPTLKLNVIQMSCEEIRHQLLLGNLDFGICNNIKSHNQLNSQLLFSQPYQLLVFRNHPLANKGFISIEELAKEPLIVLPPSHKDRMIDQLCQEVSFHPNIIFEGDSEIMREMFHANIGGILTCYHNSKQWMKLSEENYATLTITGITSRYEIYLTWSKYRYLSQQARMFKSYVFDYYHI